MKQRTSNRHEWSVRLALAALVALTLAACHTSQGGTRHNAGHRAPTPSRPSLSYNDSRRYDYFFNEAVLQQERAHYDAAYDLFSHCLKIAPERAAAWYMLSMYHSELGNDSLVIPYLEKAAALSPDNDDYLERLGQAYLSFRELDKATDIYEKLLQTDRTRVEVINILLRLYSVAENYDKMIDMVDLLEAIDGPSEETTLTKVQIYAQQGKPDKELAVLHELAAKFPNDLGYRVMVANWLLNNDKPDQAYAELKRVLDEDPGNNMARLSLLDYYRSQGNDSLVCQLTSQLILDGSVTDEYRVNLMRQFITDSQDRDDDSIRVMTLFNRLFQLPDVPEGVAVMKPVYMTAREMPPDSVSKAWSEVHQLAPHNSIALIHVIQDALRNECMDEVASLTRDAISYHPTELVFYYYHGVANIQLGHDQLAFDTFRQATQQIDKDSDPALAGNIYSILGDMLHERGLDSEAFDAYDNCLQWQPDDVGCLNNYAYFLSLKKQDLDKAEAMSSKTVKAEPTNATYLDTYAWVLFQLGRYEDARAYIDQALANDTTQNAVQMEHAGDIYARCGRTDEAVAFWKKALNAGGDTALLRRKIRLRRFVE